MKLALILIVMMSGTSFALDTTSYRGLKCKYNDAEETQYIRFDLVGALNVLNENEATLTYSTTIFYDVASDYADYESPEKNIVFGHGKDLKNARYNGTRYTNHFKFELDWHSLFASLEWGNLIISKEPVGTRIDEHGATIQTFTGALDVSYNDHHGDYVQVICERRYFPR